MKGRMPSTEGVDTPTKHLEERLIAFAECFPGAISEFPWGHRAVKVNKKVFAFIHYGSSEDSHGSSLEDITGISTKLDKADAAEIVKLSLSPFLLNAKFGPTHYGLGKHGWLSSSIQGDSLPKNPDFSQIEPYLRRWIAESYMAVAPKKLSNSADARRLYEAAVADCPTVVPRKPVKEEKSKSQVSAGATVQAEQPATAPEVGGSKRKRQLATVGGAEKEGSSAAAKRVQPAKETHSPAVAARRSGRVKTVV